MIFFAAIAVVLILASAVLLLAGREFLRINGYPPVRVHRPADLLHLMSVGYSALNQASEEAARRRMTGP
jgi:hypothetical protein